MKEILLAALRNKKSSAIGFREAADDLSAILAVEAANFLTKKKIPIQTPLAKTFGFKIKNNVILVPILRAGIAMLPSFLDFFEKAKIGFLGMKRDKKTFKPELYYQNLPKISKNDDIIILDPMLATGGSACKALEILIKNGAKQEKIIFAGIIASPQGMAKINKKFPKIKTIIAGLDKGLTKNKYIVPGLGDFGDRYFRTP